MGECGCGVVILIELAGLVGREVGGDCGDGEDAAGEVTAHGHETDLRVAARFELLQGHAYLLKMLVGKGFVDRQVVVAPAEMGGCTWLDSGTGGTGDAGDVYVAVQLAGGGQREQGQLYGGGEAAGIGHQARTGDAATVALGQAVDIAGRFVAEILRQVYHFKRGG